MNFYNELLDVLQNFANGDLASEIAKLKLQEIADKYGREFANMDEVLSAASMKLLCKYDYDYNGSNCW